MLHTKIVNVPATTETRTDYVTCDFCGTKLPGVKYEFAEVTIEYREGCRYPEGGDYVETIFDCCAQCWKSKIVPALQALGATPRTHEVDY